jgi:putative transposase
VAYIDAHRDRFGVEPICRVLTEHGRKIAPNTFWVAKKRPPSTRAVRDEELRGEIIRVHAENLDVYGTDKVWTQLNREGIRVARCTVERLMRDLGLSGVRRGKSFKVTTRSDERQHRPSDLVKRKFVAPAPNRLWVADLTYVKTHAGWVYAAFIIDVYSRMVVGWQLSNSLRTDLAIDALEMAVWNRTRAGQVLDGLIHHSDRGVQGGFKRTSQHLDGGGVTEWVSASNRRQHGQCGERSIRRVGLRFGERTRCSGFGSEFPKEYRVRPQRSLLACHPPLAVGGSEKLEGCAQSALPRCLVAISLSQSARKSPS